jgi:hypothetical protein
VSSFKLVVPLTGIEPVRYFYRGILSARTASSVRGIWGLLLVVDTLKNAATMRINCSISDCGRLRKLSPEKLFSGGSVGKLLVENPTDKKSCVSKPAA